MLLMMCTWLSNALAAQVPDPVQTAQPKEALPTAPLGADPAVVAKVDAALEQLAAGQLREACTGLQEIAERHPNTVEARWVTQIAQAVNGLQSGQCQWVPSSTEIANNGKPELFVSQGLIAPCGRPRAYFCTFRPKISMRAT